jgi:hypothetical protein
MLTIFSDGLSVYKLSHCGSQDSIPHSFESIYRGAISFAEQERAPVHLITYLFVTIFLRILLCQRLMRI